MIRSFGDKGLEKCWRDGFCKSVRPDLVERVRMKLDQIHFASRLQDLASSKQTSLRPPKPPPKTAAQAKAKKEKKRA